MKSLGTGKFIERHWSLEREGELFFETLSKLRGIKEVVKSIVLILFIPLMLKKATIIGLDERCCIKVITGKIHWKGLLAYRDVCLMMNVIARGHYFFFGKV